MHAIGALARPSRGGDHRTAALPSVGGRGGGFTWVIPIGLRCRDRRGAHVWKSDSDPGAGGTGSTGRCRPQLPRRRCRRWAGGRSVRLRARRPERASQRRPHEGRAVPAVPGHRRTVRDQPQAADPPVRGGHVAGRPRHAVRGLRCGSLRGPRRRRRPCILCREPPGGGRLGGPRAGRDAAAGEPVRGHAGGAGRSLRWQPSRSNAGDYVQLRAEQACLVVVSACPYDLPPQTSLGSLAIDLL